jgi:hypothetical protein
MPCNVCVHHGTHVSVPVNELCTPHDSTIIHNGANVWPPFVYHMRLVFVFVWLRVLRCLKTVPEYVSMLEARDEVKHCEQNSSSRRRFKGLLVVLNLRHNECSWSMRLDLHSRSTNYWTNCSPTQ